MFSQKFLSLINHPLSFVLTVSLNVTVIYRTRFPFHLFHQPKPGDKTPRTTPDAPAWAVLPDKHSHTRALEETRATLRESHSTSFTNLRNREAETASTRGEVMLVARDVPGCRGGSQLMQEGRRMECRERETHGRRREFSEWKVHETIFFAGSLFSSRGSGDTRQGEVPEGKLSPAGAVARPPPGRQGKTWSSSYELSGALRNGEGNSQRPKATHLSDTRFSPDLSNFPLALAEDFLTEPPPHPSSQPRLEDFANGHSSGWLGDAAKEAEGAKVRTQNANSTPSWDNQKRLHAEITAPVTGLGLRRHWILGS